MKAVRLNEFGGREKLVIEEIERPAPGAGQILIRNRAAGINYADTMMREGKYLTRPELPVTLGYEAAGTVEETGEGVEHVSAGDRVLATTLSGGYAEYALADARTALPIPDDLEFGEATALLVQGLTALGLLEGTRKGQSILIHAAAGGVGSLLVQLAKQRGLKVLGTASSDDKLDLVIRLGADTAIDYTETDWEEEVKRATDGRGVDLIIEMVGGEIVARNMSVLALGGTMIVYGSASGQDHELSVLSLMYKNHAVRGYWLQNETRENRERYTRELLENVRAGRLQVQVTEFPFERVQDAHEALESRRTTGKLVLTFD